MRARLTAFWFRATFRRTSITFPPPISASGEAIDEFGKGEISGEEISGRSRMEETSGCGGDLAAGHCAVCGRAEPWQRSTVQRGRTKRDWRTAGRQLPELHYLDRHRDRAGWRRRGGAWSRRVVADRPRLWTVAFRGCRTAGYLRCHATDRVLDHERNQRNNLAVRSRVKDGKTTRQPATAVKLRGLPIRRMLLFDVSPDFGNRTDGKSAAAQRHYLGPALTGAVSRAAVPGDCRCQPAARGNDDVRHRWRVHQVDVLGNRVPHTSAAAELVHFVWCTRAAAQWRNRDGMAGESPVRLGAVRYQLRGAATGADARGVLRVARHSGRSLRSTSAAVDSGGYVPAWHPDHLQPDSELQHRNAIRDCRCARQSLESPGW